MMKPLTLNLTVTVSAEAFRDLLAQAIENGTAQWTKAIASGIDQRLSAGQVQIRPVMPPPSGSAKHTDQRQEPSADQSLLIDTRQACKLLKISPRTLWTMYNSGKMPKPVRLGRTVRWSFEELRDWVNAGCPNVKG